MTPVSFCTLKREKKLDMIDYSKHYSSVLSTRTHTERCILSLLSNTKLHHLAGNTLVAMPTFNNLWTGPAISDGDSPLGSTFAL